MSVGEGFLTPGHSPEANQVLTWNTLHRRGGGVYVWCRGRIGEAFHPLLIHWTAHIYGKKLLRSAATSWRSSKVCVDIWCCGMPRHSFINWRTCLFTLMRLELSLHQHNYLIQEMHAPKSRLKYQPKGCLEMGMERVPSLFHHLKNKIIHPLKNLSEQHREEQELPLSFPAGRTFNTDGKYRNLKGFHFV